MTAPGTGAGAGGGEGTGAGVAAGHRTGNGGPLRAGGSEAPPASYSATTARTFMAIFGRDVAVTARELPTFMAQVIVQPLFLLFVFGKVLGQLGYTRPGYTELLFPGIVALTSVITGLQGVALPLVIELSFTMEIEDRLMAPIPTSLVAIEKVLFAALRAVVAAAVMFPVGVLMLGSIPWRAAAAPTVVLMVVLGAVVGATMGLVMGTLVPPNRISVAFSLVLTPLLFTGSSQYPWRSLQSLRWFQAVAACNPLTYVSEGLRGAMVPGVPHISAWVCAIAVGAFIVALTLFGMRGFARRTLT